MNLLVQDFPKTEYDAEKLIEIYMPEYNMDSLAEAMGLVAPIELTWKDNEIRQVEEQLSNTKCELRRLKELCLKNKIDFENKE